MVEGVGFEPTKLSQRIYSPPHLAALVPLRKNHKLKFTTISYKTPYVILDKEFFNVFPYEAIISNVPSLCSTCP